MYSYGKRSMQVVGEVHPSYRAPLLDIIKIVDISLLKGIRPQGEQKEVFNSGASTVDYPNSGHNILYPEQKVWAFDAMPYYSDKPGGIDWRTSKELYAALRVGRLSEANEILENIKRIHYAVGVIKGVFHAYGIPLINGNDWDGDNKFNDHTFVDSPHFQHRDWKKIRHEDWRKHTNGK